MSYAVSGFKTKKAFKDAVESGRSVYLSDTSLFTDKSVWTEDIKEGDKLDTVVGPDAYTDRRWYATVSRKNGKLKVS